MCILLYCDENQDKTLNTTVCFVCVLYSILYCEEKQKQKQNEGKKEQQKSKTWIRNKLF